MPLVSLAFAACATSAADTVDVTRPGPASVIASAGSVDVNVPTERAIVSETVDASPADAWAALPKAWADLGIEVRESSRATRSLGNSRLVVMRRLGSAPLSRYLSCGAGIQGPFADVYRIQMSIQSAVVPAQGGGVEIRTYIEAVARNPEGTSNVQVSCTSTQRLEREIAARVRAHVLGG
jgi:poly(3-hydroxybutyrate) depolymerase